MNRLKEKWDSGLRAMLVHMSGPLRLYVVNEYPKSGGTWLGQMLARALALPFPRGRLREVRRCVLHGHYLRPFGMRHCTVVWRDGRDVMVSWYFHCLFPNEFGNDALVRRVRTNLGISNPNDIACNLPRFIEYSFTKQRSPAFSWKDFVRVWHERRGVTHTSYEALRANTALELTKVLAQLTGIEPDSQLIALAIDEFSFERQSGRRPGQQNSQSFLRKGIVGDWRNHFSLSARTVFDHYAGDELIALGYEPDRRWLDLPT